MCAGPMLRQYWDYIPIMPGIDHRQTFAYPRAAAVLDTHKRAPAAIVDTHEPATGPLESLKLSRKHATHGKFSGKASDASGRLLDQSV